MKKKWIIALYIMVILAAVGASVYEYCTKGALNSSNLLRTCIIVIGAILGMVKTVTRGRNPYIGNKKALYEKAYSAQIGAAFSSMPKEGKVFYRALDDFNNDKFSASLKKLLQLEESCRGGAEQRALTFFIARNYERLKDFENAVKYYERCLVLGGPPQAANNLASCYSILGNLDKEYENLVRAVRMDPQYINGQNNLGQFLIRMGEYESAIPPLQEAHRLNSNLIPPLSGLAVCYAMTDQKDLYEKAIHRMVALGSDGKDTKDFIRSLEPPFEV